MSDYGFHKLQIRDENRSILSGGNVKQRNSSRNSVEGQGTKWRKCNLWTYQRPWFAPLVAWKRKPTWEESSPCAAMPAAQDVSQGCKELDVTIFHVKLRAAGGNKTKTPGPGDQSALRAPCLFWNEDGAITSFPTHSSLFSFTCKHPSLLIIRCISTSLTNLHHLIPINPFISLTPRIPMPSSINFQNQSPKWRLLEPLWFSFIIIFLLGNHYMAVKSNDLKIGPDRPVTGPVRSVHLDRMGIEPGSDRSNRRSNRWTGRFNWFFFFF